MGPGLAGPERRREALHALGTWRPRSPPQRRDGRAEGQRPAMDPSLGRVGHVAATGAAGESRERSPRRPSPFHGVAGRDARAEPLRYRGESARRGCTIQVPEHGGVGTLCGAWKGCASGGAAPPEQSQSSRGPERRPPRGVGGPAAVPLPRPGPATSPRINTTRRGARSARSASRHRPGPPEHRGALKSGDRKAGGAAGAMRAAARAGRRGAHSSRRPQAPR